MVKEILIKKCGECPYIQKTVNGYKCSLTAEHLNKTTFVTMNQIHKKCPLEDKQRGDNHVR